MLSLSRVQSNCVMLLCLFLLSACITSPRITPATTQNITDVELLLEKAKKSPPTERALYFFKASEQLTKQKQLDKALEVLQVIQLPALPVEYHDRYFILYAYAIKAHFPADALKQLKQLKSPEMLSDPYQLYYQSSLANSHFLLENGIAAFKAGLKMANLESEDALIKAAYQMSWESLLLLDKKALFTYRQTFFTAEELGWVTLAIDYKKYGDDPDRLLQSLAQWRSQFPEHSANRYLPTELELADKAQPYEVRQIALLLPSKGPYASSAKIIRNGFISSHLNNKGDKKPTIKVYDTSASLSAITVYEQAINEGADFIVGPLSKKKIKEITDFFTEVPVPTLALNRLENLLRADDHLYQFGMPIEDEARQVAIRAFNDGKREAVMLVPKTTSGDRAAKSFLAEFEALGGTIVAKASFTPKENHQQTVKQLLGIDKSELRKNTIRYLLDEKLEFEARRRQDADFIFLHSHHNDARQIKPFLNYYYAQNLDVYATSKVFSGKSNERDKDLSGIQFCDIPWLITPNAMMKRQRQAIKNFWPRATHTQARLYALGADAYNVIKDLAKLRAFPLYRRTGYSGKIAVNDQGWVIRELPWARFSGSKIIPLNTQ